VVPAAGDAMELVGCGRPAAGHRLAIVDPESGRRCAGGRVGEIWSAGPSVAGGYWGRPDESRATFHNRLAGEGDRDFLRTGDLGFVHDGELFVCGRLKDLLIVRGRNYYPQDVEEAAEVSHPALALSGSAAFAVEAEGGFEVRVAG
jgi:acyl-CoA synthetase (AMP-forming)/AMP-acid ligase II